MSRNIWATIIAVITITLLAACGGTSQTTKTHPAAQCLQNELNYKASTTCTGKQNTVFRVAHPVTVTCVHQNGNQYVCQTSAGATYNVTDDGQHIYYQPAL